MSKDNMRFSDDIHEEIVKGIEESLRYYQMEFAVAGMQVLPVYEFLGWSRDEYETWLRDPSGRSYPHEKCARKYIRD